MAAGGCGSGADGAVKTPTRKSPEIGDQRNWLIPSFRFGFRRSHSILRGRSGFLPISRIPIFRRKRDPPKFRIWDGKLEPHIESPFLGFLAVSHAALNLNSRL